MSRLAADQLQADPQESRRGIYEARNVGCRDAGFDLHMLPTVGDTGRRKGLFPEAAIGRRRSKEQQLGRRWFQLESWKWGRVNRNRGGGNWGGGYNNNYNYQTYPDANSYYQNQPYQYPTDNGATTQQYAAPVTQDYSTPAVQPNSVPTVQSNSLPSVTITTNKPQGMSSIQVVPMATAGPKPGSLGERYVRCDERIDPRETPIRRPNGTKTAKAARVVRGNPRSPLSAVN